jgi:hypothetical protein
MSKKLYRSVSARVLKESILKYFKTIYKKWNFTSPTIGKYIYRIRSKMWCFCGNKSTLSLSREVARWGTRYINWEERGFQPEMSICFCLECLLKNFMANFEQNPDSLNLVYSIGNNKLQIFSGNAKIGDKSFRIIQYNGNIYYWL